MARRSLVFQTSATSCAKGSSTLGAPKSACIERRTERICKAGLQLSVKIKDRLSTQLTSGIANH